MAKQQKLTSVPESRVIHPDLWTYLDGLDASIDGRGFGKEHLDALERIERALTSAPELFEVAKQIAAQVDGLDMPAELWEDLHAAIAKAEGGSK